MVLRPCQDTSADSRNVGNKNPDHAPWACLFATSTAVKNLGTSHEILSKMLTLVDVNVTAFGANMYLHYYSEKRNAMQFRFLPRQMQIHGCEVDSCAVLGPLLLPGGTQNREKINPLLFNRPCHSALS